MTTEVKIRLSLDPGNVEPAAKKAADSIQRIGTAGETSARQSAAAMRQLPAQFTDIATSLAGGQSPLLVLLQQGGQIRDSFGSVREAVRGVTSAISPAALGLGALLGAVGVIGNRALKGADEVQQLQRAIALSGETARLTVDGLNELSRSIAGQVGTRSGAVDALATITQTARVAAGDVESVTLAAIRLERAGGASIAETARALNALVRDPLQATRQFGAELGYLTPRLYEQVRALEEQGRVQEAGRVAVDAYTQAINSQSVRLEQSLGVIERSWRAVKEGALEAWDAMANAGRELTAQERLQQIQAQLDRIANRQRRRGTIGVNPAALGVVEDLQAERASINRLLLNSAEVASTGQTIAETTKRYAQARDEARRWAEEGRSATQKLNAELKKYRDNVALIRAEGGQVSESEIRASEAAIRARFAGSARGSIASSGAIRDAAQQYKAEFLRAEKQVYIELEQERARLAEQGPRDAAARAKAQERALAELDRRLSQERDFLQDLRDLNERAGLELLQDERTRGVALIQLDRRIAERRLAERGFQGGALNEAQRLLSDREQLAIEQLDQQIADRTRRSAEQGGSQISQSIAEGILDGFRNGRTFGDIFLSELKAQFARTLLEPRIRPVVEAGNEAIALLLKQLGGLFTGSQGVDTSSPGYTGYLNYRATGGDVWPYRDYVVGERGPEILRMGRMGGSVVPNDKAFGGGNVTVNVHGAPAGVERQTVRRAGGSTVVDVFLQAAAADVRSGGKLAKSMAATYGASRATGAPRRG